MGQNACLEQSQESQFEPSKEARSCIVKAESIQSTITTSIVGHLTSSMLTITEGAHPLHFRRLSLPNLDIFLQQYPFQHTEDISYNSEFVYNRTSINGERVPRHWITYSTNMKAMFYYVFYPFVLGTMHLFP